MNDGMEVGWKKWKPDMAILDQPREPVHETNAGGDSESTDKKRKTSGGSSRLCASCDLLLPALQKRNVELKKQLEKAQQELARRNYEYETLAAESHAQSRELESMRRATEGNTQMALLEIELLELKGQLADKTSECEFLDKKNAKQARELEALRGKPTGMPLPDVAGLRMHAAGAGRMERKQPEADSMPQVPARTTEAQEEALWDDILAPTDENRSAVMEALREKAKHATCQEPTQVWLSNAPLVGNVPHPIWVHRDAAFQADKENGKSYDVSSKPRDDVKKNYGFD